MNQRDLGPAARGFLRGFSRGDDRVLWILVSHIDNPNASAREIARIVTGHGVTCSHTLVRTTVRKYLRCFERAVRREKAAGGTMRDWLR